MQQQNTRIDIMSMLNMKNGKRERARDTERGKERERSTYKQKVLVLDGKTKCDVFVLVAHTIRIVRIDFKVFIRNWY